MNFKDIKGYRINGHVDGGGFATVYRAVYTGEGVPPYGKEEIAIKVLHPWKKDRRSIQQFEKEARLSISFNHPNVIKTYDFFKENSDYIIIMEYLEGANLADIIKDKKTYSLSQLLFFLIEIAKGLSYIHNHGIVHKDIKPENVVVSKDLKRVKITDFGVAKPISFWRKDSTPSGTVTYASPEQKAGRRLDYRSDIYSYGKLMFELLAEKIPHKSGRREDRAQIKFAIRFGTRPRTINPNIPRFLEDIIIKATKKDPQQRFQDMEEIVSSLMNFSP